MKFLNNIDLDQNQIIKLVLEKRTTADGSGVEGQIIYREDTDTIKYNDGTSWITLASSSASISSVTAGDGISDSGTANDPILDVNVDNATIEINSDSLRIKSAGVDTSHLATDAVTTIKITDKNVTFAKINDIPTMTVIGRVAGGTGVSSAISILNENDLVSNSSTSLATQSSIKAYVDANVASLGTLIGSFDASTETNFPSGSTKGDYWYVSANGTVQSIKLNIGDVLIANKDSASTTSSSDWIFLETNRDQATTTVLGLVTLATSIEAIAGTDPNKVITPATLKAVLDDTVGGYATNMGNGVAKTFSITHSLGTLDVVSDIIEVSSGDKVIADVSHSSTNQVDVTFAKAPTSNQYRIIIKK